MNNKLNVNDITSYSKIILQLLYLLNPVRTVFATISGIFVYYLATTVKVISKKLEHVIILSNYNPILPISFFILIVNIKTFIKGRVTDTSPEIEKLINEIDLGISTKRLTKAQGKEIYRTALLAKANNIGSQSIAIDNQTIPS
jgi:hypothetical protein